MSIKTKMIVNDVVKLEEATVVVIAEIEIKFSAINTLKTQTKAPMKNRQVNKTPHKNLLGKTLNWTRKILFLT